MPVKTLKTRMLMKMKTLKARIYYPTILFFLLYSQISSQVIGMHCSALQSPLF